MRGIRRISASVRQLFLLFVMIGLLFAALILAAPLAVRAGSEPMHTSALHIETNQAREYLVTHGTWQNDELPTPEPPTNDRPALQYSWISILLCMVSLNIITIVVALGFKRRFQSIGPQKR